MKLTNLLTGYPPYEGLVKNMNNTPVSAAGVVSSAQPQLIAQLTEQMGVNALVVTYSDSEALKLCSDLRLYTDNAVMFPSKEYVFYNIEAMGRANDNARLSVLDKIAAGRRVIAVASAESLMTYTADKHHFQSAVTELKTGDVCDTDKLLRSLAAAGYSRVEMIEGAGQLAVRGGIIDVYSPNYENPIRIELWGDEIDSIRSFDTDSQRAIENIDSVRIIPVSEALYTDKRRGEIILELERRLKNASQGEKYAKTLKSDIESFNERYWFPSADKYISLIYGDIPSLIDYFSDEDLVFVVDPKRICERFKSFEWEQGEMISQLKEQGIIGDLATVFYKSGGELISQISKKKMIALEILSHTKNDFSFNYLTAFNSKTTVSFHGKIEYLFEDLKKWQSDGYTAAVLAASDASAENLAGVFNGRDINSRIYQGGEIEKGETVIIKGSGGGFEYSELKFVLVSEQEIFNVRRSKERRKNNNADRIKSYNDISPGDYVIHSAHGVGQYDGIQKMTVGGVSKDYLKILYSGNDVLYVPVGQLNMLYKYCSGDEGKNVKLNRLGTQEWSRAKGKVKKSTDELAKQLVKLYAERETAKGYAFSEDTPWQRQFEDTFEFNETEDQLRSIEEVKADMERPVPMDRLLCGDVGFGKTEVALRAAFKAVCDGKQVVYLCPTTILAMQHYETFLNRMSDFPVTVEMLSRFRTAKQQKEIIKKLADGRVDIVIGTHRLLSGDIHYKDLGLLIIDEEQRFGVAHKEKIKELKKNIDVLTMTATPIPRTLHMAMTSVRDMSVLSQPPQNRYPVQTYVLEFDEDIILEAIRREIARGGQVFYLYNRVRGLFHKAEWLRENLPGVAVAVANGQMSENELEDIMYDMVNGTTQVLVCTTIIETGLDIPNANTMIIENADKMGLAQLYQLRGRVGRSNRAAYAYLTYRRDKILSDVSQKRLSAIREFTEFGSGFKIAMRDLEIRGAGNILGSEQHGHMDDVGYDMYCKILKESIAQVSGEQGAKEEDVLIDVNINAYIPESYIPSVNQRIDMYKRIAAAETAEDRSDIEDELIDRYGEMPRAVTNIMKVAALKIEARKVGCREITEKADMVTLKFAPDRLSPGIVFGLDGKYPGRVKVISGDEPALRITMLPKDKSVLAFTRQLLNELYQMQNSDKQHN